jgi:hypothetical protein
MGRNCAHTGRVASAAFDRGPYPLGDL